MTVPAWKHPAYVCEVWDAMQALAVNTCEHACATANASVVGAAWASAHTVLLQGGEPFALPLDSEWLMPIREITSFMPLMYCLQTRRTGHRTHNQCPTQVAA